MGVVLLMSLGNEYSTTTPTTSFSAIHTLFTIYILQLHRLFLEMASTDPNGDDRLGKGK